MKKQLVHVVLTTVVATLPTLVSAQWQTDGVPISTVADLNASDVPVIVEDGAGGAIIAWLDRRSGAHNDVYAQRVNAGGVVQWTDNGVAVCPIVSEHRSPKIVSDGANGAIVIWNDFRSGTSRDVYAQRLDGDGVPQWAANGVPVCTATEDQWLSAAVSDGAGGAFIVWDDRRNGSHYDVYIQHVDASGSVTWTPDGVPLCTSFGDQRYPRVVASAGGAIVAWDDERSFWPSIFAQRVDAAGATQWANDGVALCTQLFGRNLSAVVTDGAGGAIAVWIDGRSGFWDPFAQRISVAGVPQWNNNGNLINFNSTDDLYALATSDGAGGAVVAWTSRNDATMTYYVSADRINGSGVTQWGEYGAFLFNTPGSREATSITSDGAGGAIVAVMKSEFFNTDVYAQRVDGAGVSQWGDAGATICTDPDFQHSPAIATDGAGGAILAWYDGRSDVGNDVYAQHVTSAGDVPTAVEVPRAPSSLLAHDIYPNPFSAIAVIDLELAAPSSIRLDFFDVAGKRVRRMWVADSMGSRRVEFDGRDHAGKLLPSGVYFCRIEAAGETVTRKIVIAR